MYQVFVILAVITAVLLTILVLIQNSKGGGLASNFASSNAIMGVRKTTNVVEKATWSLAALLVVFSIASYYAKPTQDSLQQDLINMPTTNSAVPTVPAAPVSPAPAK